MEAGQPTFRVQRGADQEKLMYPKLVTEFCSLRCIVERREFARRNGMLATLFASVVCEHVRWSYADSHR